MKRNVESDGFHVVRHVIDASEIKKLVNLLGPVSSAGRRGLLKVPEVAEFARSSRALHLIQPHFATRAIPVRAIYFDKSPDANWLVPWHQDLTIAVRERLEIPGFGPWSVKDGVSHVQPPVELLEQMLTLRIHFDDADEKNGALRVLPGSHKLGKLGAEEISELRKSGTEELCVAAAGDALLMQPLLLHASSRSTSDRHRRILHIEYAAFALPPGMHWHEGQ